MKSIFIGLLEGCVWLAALLLVLGGGFLGMAGVMGYGSPVAGGFGAVIGALVGACLAGLFCGPFFLFLKMNESLSEIKLELARGGRSE